MSQDYYKTLGVAKDASPDEIKRAYRKLAHQYHPDKGGDAVKFKEINEAYQVLSDPQKRAQYDKFGSAFSQAQSGGGFSGANGFGDFSSFAEAFNNSGNNGGRDGFGFEDIFEGIFGRASSRSRRGGGRQRGGDIGVDAEITLEEAWRGVEREVNLYKGAVCSKCGGQGAEPGYKLKECPVCHGQGEVEQRAGAGFFTFSQIKTCPNCHGAGKTPEKNCSKCGGDGRVKEQKTIRIKIPAGIQDGQVISVSGQGEAARFGGVAGDLYITVRVKPDPRFRRENDDLIYELQISFSQAALGGSIEISTLSGWIKLKIPAGTESGAMMRLEGKGMPRLSRKGFGDMMVKIKVRTPKHLSSKAKELLEELRDEID